MNMRIANILYNGKAQLAFIEDDGAILLSSLVNIESSDMLAFIEEYDQSILEQMKAYNGHKISLDALVFLAPIPYPRRNLFCLGKNYYDHAMEMVGKTSDLVGVPTEPIYFSKVCRPALDPDGVIDGHIGVTEQVDYEVELAVIIGKKGRNIALDDAKDYIFGYTIVNDISARDIQKKHIQWHRGKSLDGFCPMGPLVLMRDAVSYPPQLSIKSYVNGDLRQDGHTRDLIFSIDRVINELSNGMTLLPGDIILMGTPAGVGMGFNPPKFLKSNDTVTCEIQHIGQLSNRLK